MQVWIGDESSARGAVGQVDDQLVEAGKPLRMRLQLAADEELAEVALFLCGRSSAAATASFSAPELASDAATEGSFSGVSWVSADWGGSRSLAKLALKIAANPPPAPDVHVKIARGGSGWFSPPGPHSFGVDGAGEVAVSFPDTVADRVMLELRDADTGAPVVRDLLTPGGASSVLPLSFGNTARDPELRLAGERALFEHPGVIAIAAEVEVGRLLALLRERVEGPLRDRDLELEAGAKAAGLLGLRWELTVDRLLEHFDASLGEQAALTAELGWSTPFEHTLPVSDAAVHGLTMRVEWTPSSERIELSPDPDPVLDDPAPDDSPSGPDSAYRGFAGLLRPRYSQAQGFTRAPTRPLRGVDLWVRAPRAGMALELTLDLVADEGGAPGSTLLGSATLSLAAGQTLVGPRPSWLRVDLPEPLLIEVERWWVVARVDEGELAWLMSAPDPQHLPAFARRPELSEVRHRRDEGPWLSREAELPHSWALTRLRVHESMPAPAPTLELLVDGTAHPLVPSADAPGRFELLASKPSGAQLSLRASSAVAGTLTLSQLQLRWRPKPFDPLTDAAAAAEGETTIPTPFLPGPPGP